MHTYMQAYSYRYACVQTNIHACMHAFMLLKSTQNEGCLKIDRRGTYLFNQYLYSKFLQAETRIMVVVQLTTAAVVATVVEVATAAAAVVTTEVAVMVVRFYGFLYLFVGF